MKCIVLAGGIGNSLWPLSRKNYPKQFMNIREGRSLLQDTIVRNMPFADELFKDNKGAQLELKVKVIDIRYSSHNKLVTKKDTLEQYSRFIQIIEDCRKSEENLDEAMKKAVNMAIENNILTEFLKENGSEVRNMLTLEYDEETARRVEREEAMEEGRREGGEQARRQLIISCLRKFKSCEVVADILDIPVEEVQKIKDNM